MPQACLQGHPILSKLETSTTWLALETTQGGCWGSGTRRRGSCWVGCSAKLELELELEFGRRVWFHTLFRIVRYSLTLTRAAADLFEKRGPVAVGAEVRLNADRVSL